MSVKYNIKVIDLVTGNLYIMYKFPYNLIFIFFIICMWILNNNLIDKDKTIIFKIIFNIITILPILLVFNIILFILLYLIFGIINILGKDKSIFCEHELSIVGDKLIAKTSVYEYHRIISSIKLYETKKYVYIFVTSLSAHIIPKKRIDSKELNEFLQELKSIMEKCPQFRTEEKEKIN